MTEKRFKVSTRFDGHEIEELQQYKEEELFEWGKDFADEDGRLSGKLAERTLESLREELERFKNKSFDENIEGLWIVRNKFFDENGDNGTEETEEAQEIFDGGMLTRYEETLKSVIQEKEDEIERGENVGRSYMEEGPSL